MPIGTVAVMVVGLAAGATERPALLGVSPSLTLASGPADADPGGTPAPADQKEFGTRGAWSFGVRTGVAFSGDATEANAQIHLGTFLTEGFEFTFGVGGWHHSQDGEDAQSINPEFGFRYHFDATGAIDPYIDVGIGLLFSTDDVPADGTSINFTPRAGGGVLWRLDPESGLRLDTGVRWHHISNATTSGSDDNPSRDGVMVYVGLIVPF